MDVALRELAARQFDLVASWQLLQLGWTRAMIDHRVATHGWRVMHPGVYLLTSSPPTQRQRWRAGTLTTPESHLSHACAAACWGFQPTRTRLITITRPGSGGPRQYLPLVIFRSTTVATEVTGHESIPVTTPERTLIDLAGASRRQVGRMLREALRLKITTAPRVAAAAARHPNRRGVAKLAGLAARYRSLPYARTRSNAEARALEVLHDAGVDPPRVNHRIAGEEADLVWLDRGLVIEVDGPDFHRFKDEDARKQSVWEGAGFTLRRIPSDGVYDDPARLVALAAA